MRTSDATLPDITHEMARHNSFEEPTERSHLLPHSPEQHDASPRAKTWQQSWEKIMLLILTVLLLVSLGDQWQETPHARIMESVICYRYFEEADPSKLLLPRDRVGPGAIGGVAEMWCKADAVQSELAMLRGWQATFDGLPGLILALPIGWAADKIGRKPFVVAGMLAFILRSSWMELVLWFWQSFNIKATWLSTIFASIGGGNVMTTTFLFVLLSDITPEAQRASAFLRAGAVNMLAQLVMPPFAAWLMKYNPWIPAIGGTFLMTLSALLYLACPETLDFHKDLSSINEVHLDSLATEDATQLSTRSQTFKSRAQHVLLKLKQACAFLLDDWRVPALILPFIMHMLIGTISQLLLQYLSKRYGLTFSNATLLMTVRSGGIVLLLFAILPYLSAMIMQKYQLSGPRKDLYLARVSLAVLVVGWLLVGLSPNIPIVAISLAISALGQGFALLIRSFLTSLLPTRHIARVYSIISIVDTGGMMVGSPLLAALFKRGLALGGAGIGLPFYLTAMIGFMFLLLLMVIPLRKSDEGHVSVEEDQ